MNSFIIRALLLVSAVLLVPPLLRAQTDPPLLNWNWSWTAPEPPLPNTEWYDYGWDSTSNGPVPAQLAQRAARVVPAPPLPPGLQIASLNTLSPIGAEGQGDGAAPQKSTSLSPIGGEGRGEGAAAPKAGLAYTRPQPGRFYADSFLSLATPNFSKANYGYGVGLGYQVTKYWSGEIRATHKGLDYDGSAIQTLGGRLVARMPFEFLSPYTFLGAAFDLEDDRWRLQPGAGLELGVSKKLRGLSIFGEAGLDADLKGRNGYLFTSGFRLRF